MVEQYLVGLAFANCLTVGSGPGKPVEIGAQNHLRRGDGLKRSISLKKRVSFSYEGYGLRSFFADNGNLLFPELAEVSAQGAAAAERVSVGVGMGHDNKTPAGVNPPSQFQ